MGVFLKDSAERERPSWSWGEAAKSSGGHDRNPISTPSYTGSRGSRGLAQSEHPAPGLLARVRAGARAPFSRLRT